MCPHAPSNLINPEPRQSSVPNELRQRLVSARCIKSQGYKDVNGDWALCGNCYAIALNQAQYEPHTTHHVIDDIRYLLVACYQCNKVLTIIGPASSCVQCIEELLSYLITITLAGFDPRNLPRSLTLRITRDPTVTPESS